MFKMYSENRFLMREGAMIQSVGLCRSYLEIMFSPLIAPRGKG
jgi:hypothetical protein